MKELTQLENPMSDMFATLAQWAVPDQLTPVIRSTPP